LNPVREMKTAPRTSRSVVDSPTVGSAALPHRPGPAWRPSPDAAIQPIHSEGKLLRISSGEEPPARTRQALEKIAQLPYVDSVLALPDVHWKDRMEVPSSIAITTRDVIVPEFASMDINDGMGVMKTSLRADEMSSARIADFFMRVNSHAAAHFFDANRYSITASELRSVLVHGARALLSRYGFDESLLRRMEGDGHVTADDLSSERLSEIVPPLLLTPFSRCEMGLNFGGNHFLEVQVVDAILDQKIAARWGFELGQVVVMYHLGPGPFGGALLHHCARRSKLRRERVLPFFLSKLLFHYAQRMGRGSFSKKWGHYFRRNGWTPTSVDSQEGMFLRQALAMATNFGYGYRMATMRAIADGLHETISPSVGCELVCDVSHNSLQEEQVDGRAAWVARHNACRLETGSPAIVAGTCDIPSYLGIGGEGANDRLHSYDHGAGHIISGYRQSGRLTATRDVVTRTRMTRGRRGRVVAQEVIRGQSSKPIDGLMESFQSLGMIESVLRLRPIGNFKN
jgi:tRNA-splicing ligase RtcB